MIAVSLQKSVRQALSISFSISKFLCLLLFIPEHFEDTLVIFRFGQALACHNLKLYLGGDGRKVRRPPRSNNNDNDNLFKNGTAEVYPMSSLSIQNKVDIGAPIKLSVSPTSRHLARFSVLPYLTLTSRGPSSSKMSHRKHPQRIIWMHQQRLKVLGLKLQHDQ